MKVRNLVVVFGDQLNEDSAAFDGFDRSHDAVWMAEVRGESEQVTSHKARIVLFLSSMRHFRDRLRNNGYRVIYRMLDDPGNRNDLATELRAALQKIKPRKVIAVRPGAWRVECMLQETAGPLLEMRSDRSFFCSRKDFESHAHERKQLRMEFFYRELRRRTGLLMEGNNPVGGKWNYDALNRGAFGKEGPGELPLPPSFPPDRVTRKVMQTVEQAFPGHPGSLEHFDWPLTPRQAQAALDDFVEHRLARFGDIQDAMWTEEPFLCHALLSSALNLKLIDPRTVVEAAEKAFHEGRVPLASAEGFIRQILGWREYVRGIYWQEMPAYLEMNALDATRTLPGFYWTAETEMRCLRAVIEQTMAHGYAHHIQRLMVTGLFALLLGVQPREVHRWYLAVYVDAVEWVELPNTLGMSQYGDGGIMASKPYIATGKYIQRMSNYCADCSYRPEQRVEERACPFTTLYWDFLLRHEKRLRKNPRMGLQMRNLQRIDREEQRLLQRKAGKIKASLG